MQSNEIRILPLTTYKNQRYVKDVNLRSETMKLLGENVGETLQENGVGDDFLDETLKVQESKAKLNIWEYHIV